MDIRMWSRELIADLLNLYKSYPCLWKIKSDCYKNKKLRDCAYANLVQFCKDRGFPTANRDFVVKKIQSLRGSFRKELKKVEASRGSGAVETYEPSLWYYDLLAFTKDQELAIDTLSNDTEEALEDRINEQQISQEESRETGVVTVKIENVTSQDHETLVVEERSRGTGGIVSEGTRNETSHVTSPQKKKKKLADSFQEEFLAIISKVLKSNSKPLTEYEAYGINVAKKIEKMDELQAIYAESLISSVLREGLLKKLNANSTVCNGACKPGLHRQDLTTHQPVDYGPTTSTSE